MESEDDYYYYSDEEAYSAGEEEENDTENSKVQLDSPLPAGADGLASDKSDASRGAADGGFGTGAAAGEAATKASSSRKLIGGTDEYAVLTPDLLEEEQDKLVRNVAEILDIDYDTANVLLLYFRWNKEMLFDAYYADPEGTCKKAGAVSVGSAMEADVAAGSAATTATHLCEILFIEVPFKETFAMACGHRFSLTAWQCYLRSKVGDGKDCIFARCASDVCKATVSPKTWVKVLTAKVAGDEDSNSDEEENRTALRKYKRFLAESFVDINRTMRYCPGRGCNVAIKSTGAVSNVKCTECGALFCFKCGEEAHAPTTCKWLAMWRAKCSNESETANWILVNTKTCPKCATRIEKNQGCNHMQCKVCKFDFCWVCMGSWTDHGNTTGGYYNCNRFKTSETAVAKDDKAGQARRELERYLHYYERFSTHENSGKFAAGQRQMAETRMVEMQAENALGWVDVQFLLQAVEQLIDCRRVLKNTYIHAYYLPDGPKKDLFEYLQDVLLCNTEKLSELTEKPLDKMDRAEVINFTRVTGNFLRSLLEQVDSEGIGMDDDSAAVGAGVQAGAASASAATAAVSASSKGAGSKKKRGFFSSSSKK